MRARATGVDPTTHAVLQIASDELDDDQRAAVLLRHAGPRLVKTAQEAQLAASLAERIRTSTPAVQRAFEPMGQVLDQSRWSAQAHHTVRHAQAADVLRMLTTAGLQVVPIKGLWIAERYYGQPFEREMGDLDLVVGAAVDEAAQVLLAAGARWMYTDPAIRDHQRTQGMHVVVVPPGRQAFPVELHWRLYPDQAESAIDALMHNARRGQCAGVAVDVPRHEDQLLVSVHHLTINLNRRPDVWRWWLDIDRMVRTQTDWDRLLELARAWGDLLPLATVLAGAGELMDTPVPASFSGRLEAALYPAERAVLHRALHRGVMRLNRDEVLAVTVRARGLGWRTRRITDLLWPHAGEVAQALGIRSDAPGFALHRVRYALARGLRLARVTFARPFSVI